MFGASKTPFGGGGFGAKPAFGAQQTTPFGATSGGLFGGTSTGTNLFGAKTTASTGFGFGTTSTGGGGMFGSSSVFQAPQTFGQAQPATGTTIKFVPPTSSEQAQKSGLTMTIKTQNQCITVMDQYKSKCVEELRLEDYEAGRKTGTAAAVAPTGFGSTASTGLFGQTASSSGGLFGSSTSTTGGFGGFGKTSTTGGGLFGSTSTGGGGLFGAKTTASLFGSTTTTSSGFGGFGTGGGLFGAKSSAGTGLFGSTTTTSSSLFGGTGFGATASSGASLFGSTPAFGAAATQSSLFGAQSKPAFGFGATTSTFGSPKTGGLFGATSSTGGLFGATAQKPAFSFGAGGTTGFGATSTGFGFGATTSSSGGLFGGTSTGTGLFGTKPTGFGTTFGATSTGGSLFGGTGLGGTTGFGGTQSTGFSLGGPTLGGAGNIDQGTLAALQQQQLIQQQIKALANTPFGDSPLFRNLAEPKAKSTQNTTSATAKEPINTSQYKVLARPAARVKPRPISSPSLGKSHLFEGLEEEGDFSPHPLVPRRSVKKLVLKNKTNSEAGSPFEEGHLKLRPRTTGEDDSTAPSPEVTSVEEPPGESPPAPSLDETKIPTFETLADLNHEESTPLTTKTKNYVITPLQNTLSEDSVAAETTTVEAEEEVVEPVEEGETTEVELDEVPKCQIVLKRPDYYTKPSLSELAELVNEDQSQCLVQGFIVGKEGYGEVKFLGVTDVFGLNLDEIVSFSNKEVEVYADDYEDKPEVGKELNKPAEITLLGVWPNDKSTHTPIKTPERLKASGFIDRIEEKTAEMDAVFVDYRPGEGAWVFKVNHFTRYGLREEIFDESVTKGIQDVEPLTKLADDVSMVKEEMKMKLDTLNISQEVEDDTNMEEGCVDDTDVTIPPTQEEDYSEMEDFLSTSHQLNKVANVPAFNLQGMKSSVLYEDDDDEITTTTKTQKRPQLFSNRSMFGSSNVEATSSSRPQSPFPKLDLSSNVQQSTQDPLNSTVFQNLTINQDDSTVRASKIKKKSHLFQTGVVDKSILSDDTTCEQRLSSQPPGEETLYVKCRSYKMLPYEQSLLFAKTNLLADASLTHGREFNVRWCSDMKLVHAGNALGAGGGITKKIAASVFTGNFVSPSSNFGLGNSNVNVEKIEKNPSGGLRKYLTDCLEISLDNTSFVAGKQTPLELLRIRDGVTALADYTQKTSCYRQAHASDDIDEFLLQSNVWNLVSSLWGKLDDDMETPYEIHAARRKAFSQWLSTVVDKDVQEEIRAVKTKDEGHLSVILSLLSANKLREACKVARDNKELRLAFLLSQVRGDHRLKNYLRSQLCLWEERMIDTFMSIDRLKIYVLLSGMMVWKSIKSNSLVNLCENVNWNRALALHLWYHCAQTATIENAFEEYRNAYRGTDVYPSYAAHPSPRYLIDEETSSNETTTKKTKDICYHLIALYCKREHSLAKLLTPKTYTPAPLDYHLSWHLHEVLYALGYEHLSEDKHSLLQHSYAAELELIGLWHWSVFVLMHIRDDHRRERCIKEILNRYCRVSDDEENVLKLTEEETTIVDKFHVPLQWVHQSKALHAKFVGRHYDEALHLMRAGHWNEAHIVVADHLCCDAIIEEDYDTLKGILNELSLPERCCTIKNWRIGGQVFLDYIMLKEKIEGMKASKEPISSYHLEDMEGEVASLINRIGVMKVTNSRERLCQSEMARTCSSMQKFVLSYANTRDGDADSDAPKWPTAKVAPYILNLPLPPDYYLKELRELLGNYANEIELNERNT